MIHKHTPHREDRPVDLVDDDEAVLILIHEIRWGCPLQPNPRDKPRKRQRSGPVIKGQRIMRAGALPAD